MTCDWIQVNGDYMTSNCSKSSNIVLLTPFVLDEVLDGVEHTIYWQICLNGAQINLILSHSSSCFHVASHSNYITLAYIINHEVKINSQNDFLSRALFSLQVRSDRTVPAYIRNGSHRRIWHPHWHGQHPKVLGNVSTAQCPVQWVSGFSRFIRVLFWSLV